jgi:hypothetical protein
MFSKIIEINYRNKSRIDIIYNVLTRINGKTDIKICEN